MRYSIIYTFPFPFPPPSWRLSSTHASSPWLTPGPDGKKCKPYSSRARPCPRKKNVIATKPQKSQNIIEEVIYRASTDQDTQTPPTPNSEPENAMAKRGACKKDKDANTCRSLCSMLQTNKQTNKVMSGTTALDGSSDVEIPSWL